MKPFVCVLAASLTALSPLTASAQQPPAREAPDSDAGTEPSALRLGREALALYEEGHWDNAYARFDEAEQLAHSPVFVLYMARCRRNVGRLLEAEELLARTSAEPPSATPRLPWQRAVAEARAEHAALRDRIPHLTLQSSRNSEPLSVQLDDRELSPSEIGQRIPLDPGRHRVVARTGQHEVTQIVVLAEGDANRTLDLTLAPPTRAAARVPLEGANGPLRISGYALLGVGALGLGTGVTAGIVAAVKTSRITDNCEGTHCLKSDSPAGANASRWASWSTAGFIVGTVASSAGALCLLLSPRKPVQQSSRATEIQLAIGASGAALIAAF